MKKIYVLIYFVVCIFSSAFSQSGTWTWVSGSNQINSTGVFGTQGVPSVSNHPPGLYEPAEWKDKQGNFWMFGGVTAGWDFYSDLWKFNPVTKEWTWVKGNGLPAQSYIYGTQGVPDSSNTPGARSYACVTWVDTSSALWLFGGAASNYVNCKNDLWKYDIGANQWTWMKGDSIIMAKGVHGTSGMPAPANTPGARSETCSGWTDSLNNLWLFGGYGYDENGSIGYLNDLCKYDINTNEWTWMKGSAYAGATANYGIKGITNINNDPGARFSYTKWKDTQGNFWLMGGFNNVSFSDVWKYDIKMNEWTWMSGTNASNDAGKYHANCVFDTVNVPYSRMEQRSSVSDSCGRFWLFGGANLYSGNYNFFNDLWIFDPQQLKWSWISGTNAPDQPGNYGTLGVPSISNMPPSRMGAVAWWGNDNRFYMFGGSQNERFITDFYSDVWVFNPDTSCLSSCGAVAALPPVTNFESGKTTICANDCINFTDLSTNNPVSWQWLFPGAIDSTSTAQNPQSVCYEKAGIYNVTLIASDAGGSDSATFTNYITVNAVPLTPFIIQIGTTLYCSTNPSYISYQWFDDTTLIAGATDTSLVISHGGNYNVQVTNSNNCKIAVGINIILGIQNYMNNNLISIFPNPTQEKFTIYDLRFTIARMEIYNVLGQVCQQSEITNPKSEIDVSSLPSGIYFVQVITEGGRWMGRFVKE